MASKEKIVIENAKIIFKNFSGKGTDYNAEGDRNFCVVLDDEQAESMKAMGYNVKTKLPREGYEDDGNFNFLKIKVSLKYGDNRDAEIYRIVGNNRVKLTDKTVSTLDWDEIENIDMRIRPWNWTKGNRSGVAAFLDTMYVTVKEDSLDAKYSGDYNFAAEPEDPF